MILKKNILIVVCYFGEKVYFANNTAPQEFHKIFLE